MSIWLVQYLLQKNEQHLEDSRRKHKIQELEYEIDRLKREKECAENQLRNLVRLKNQKTPCYHAFNVNQTGYSALIRFGCICKKN